MAKTTAPKKRLQPGSWTTGKNVAAPAPYKPVVPTLVQPPAPVFKPPAFAGDAVYFGNLAQQRQQRDATIGQLRADDVYDTQSNESYLQQLAKNQATTNRSTANSAAKRGLSNSGFLAKSVADTAANTQQLAGTASAALAKAISDRGRQFQSLTQQYGDPNNPNDYGLAGASEWAAANQRFVDTDPGASATGPAAAAPAAAAAGRPASGNKAFPYKNSKTGEAYKDQTIGGVKYHVYANGKKVKV